MRAQTLATSLGVGWQNASSPVAAKTTPVSAAVTVSEAGNLSTAGAGDFASEAALDSAVAAVTSFFSTEGGFSDLIDATVGVTVGDNSSVMPLGESASVAEEADDAVWILTSTFIIFTMQSGFGLLESGSVTSKNEVNIMVKNAVDVIFGGLTYWMFGYGFSFGNDPNIENSFCGWGNFFLIANGTDFGSIYAKFFFQASFATTATTIVSGSMAERTKLEAYIMFSLLNTFIYCFPAHWLWGTHGWLNTMGAIDVAGAGPVHLVGGCTGLTATLILKPRHRRYKDHAHLIMASPTNAVLGMFMLWWGWLGFNTGSTFGISGKKWILASRSAVATVNASISGGIVGFLLSYITKDRKFDVGYMINGILGSLVGITGICVFAEPWEALIIGLIGALCVLGSVELMDKLKIDDPVGCVGVHGVGSIWSMLAVGLFMKSDSLKDKMGYEGTQAGLFYGGGFYLLGVQALAVLSIMAWTLIVSVFFLKLIDVTIGLRMPLKEEILGADIVEHSVGQILYDKKKQSIVGYYDDNGRKHAFSTAALRQMEFRSSQARLSRNSIAEFIKTDLKEDSPSSVRRRSQTMNGQAGACAGSLRRESSRESAGMRWKRVFRKHMAITRHGHRASGRGSRKDKSNQNVKVYHICGRVKVKTGESDQTPGSDTKKDTPTPHRRAIDQSNESEDINDQSDFQFSNAAFTVDELDEPSSSRGCENTSSNNNDLNIPDDRCDVYMKSVEVEIHEDVTRDGLSTYL